MATFRWIVLVIAVLCFGTMSPASADWVAGNVERQEDPTDSWEDPANTASNRTLSLTSSSVTIQCTSVTTYGTNSPTSVSGVRTYSRYYGNSDEEPPPYTASISVYAFATYTVNASPGRALSAAASAQVVGIEGVDATFSYAASVQSTGNIQQTVRDPSSTGVPLPGDSLQLLEGNGLQVRISVSTSGSSSMTTGLEMCSAQATAEAKVYWSTP